MRRAALALVLVACRTTSNDPHPAAATARPPPAPKTLAVTDAVATPTAASEAPLAWGTRPAATGPLYPVVDGMCVHGEIWSTKPDPIFSYGNATDLWSRGSTRPTLARFADEGLVLDASLSAETGISDWNDAVLHTMFGTWPALYAQGETTSGGRVRSYETIWSHEAAGWKVLGSHQETGEPVYTNPVLFRQWLIAGRNVPVDYENLGVSTIKSWPTEKDAAPIAGLASLARSKLRIQQLAASDTTLYALGWVGDATPLIVRWLSEGKSGELSIAVGSMTEPRVIGTTATALYVILERHTVYRIENGKATALPLKVASDVRIEGTGIAPNGDVWLLTSAKVLIVAHGDTLTETPLPAPAHPRSAEHVLHWPSNGSALGGVEIDDPYAIGAGGALFHLVNGAWSEVELPTPPFATIGRYQAQTVIVPAKGDPFVNVGYAEKGIGWKTQERYRAILRAKRPKEVLRCNEPSGGVGYASGHGFMSFPPIATDACTTPFVILLRLGWEITQSSAFYMYDRKSDYPSVREAIKATPSLGASVDLVELVSGEQRYLGARVPNLAAGKELGEAVVKAMKGYLEIRPEVVCGTPKAERTIHVDLATGKTTSAPVTAP